MELEIITPEKNLFHGKVKSVYVPGTNGALGILDKHAPMITTLKAGDVRIDGEDGKQAFAIKGGVVEVLHNKVIILAE
jgi:F-type H+-transporting ATPase subunit epsilon